MKTPLFRTLLVLSTLFAGAVTVFAGATLTVNDSSTGNNCNQTLSLDEAVELGRNFPSFLRNYTDGEKAQVQGATWVRAAPSPNCPAATWRALDGTVGDDSADDIFFTDSVGVINGPVQLGHDDDINGLKPNGTKVILDGTGRPALTDGITNTIAGSVTGSQIRNLEIRNFPGNGIELNHPNGVILEGLVIHDNGLSGVLLPFQSFNIPRNSRNVTVGGDQPQHRNLIYANGRDGIEIVADPSVDRGNSQNIKILNNFIGTSDGTSDNGNARHGISLSNAFGVLIGSDAGTSRNVISGNNGDGIAISGNKSVGNEIFFNYIGVNSNGNAVLGNSGSGVTLNGGAGNSTGSEQYGPNLVGRVGFPNTIGGNNVGVFISDSATGKNVVQSNYIGTNSSFANLGNSLDGVYIDLAAFNNRVGGGNDNEGNTIAFNNRRGIWVKDGTGNTLRRNRLFSNAELGIDLGAAGVTANDTGDADGGANRLQNYPLITYLNVQLSTTRVEGTFNGAANATFTLDFYGNTEADPSGSGEGRNYIGTTMVTTDASGNASYALTFSNGNSVAGTFVTATATSESGDTSEFSPYRYLCADLRTSPSGYFAPGLGGSGSFTVIKSVNCSYTPAASQSWIIASAPVSDVINFTVLQNTGAQRTSNISLTYANGVGFFPVFFTITQAANGCTYTLTPASVNLGSGSANQAVGVTTQAGCQWTTTTNDPWISAPTPSGTGSGTAILSVGANTGVARTGTATIAGQTFTVNQSGCGVTLGRPSINLGTGSMWFEVAVTAASSCSWQATSNDSWLTVDGAASRSGGGVVRFLASASNSGNRTGTLTIGGQTFTVNQTTSCVYAPGVAGQGSNAPASTLNYNVTATAGCGWRIPPGEPAWITVASSGGVGNGLITMNLSANTTTSFRRYDWTFAGVQMYATQRSSCVFTTATPTVFAPPTGGSFGPASVLTGAGCIWNATTTAPWLTPATASNNNGSQNMTLNIEPNPTAARRVASFMVLQGDSTFLSILVVQPGRSAPFDFDGDRRTEFGIFRPADGSWWYPRSSAGNLSFAAFSFGTSTDIIVPGDYTGDGKADVAVFRPSTGQWFVMRSEDNSYFAFPFGQNGDIPSPADFDGDGKTDAAIFRPSTATWYIAPSSGSGTIISQFGAPTDKPVAGDFDGDGRADIAIFRQSDGSWWYVRSSDSVVVALSFGTSTDIPTPGDFTGDGKTDVAIFRPSNGNWFVLRSEDQSFYSFPFGANGDIPATGDYDGDGKFDAAVFRNGVWYAAGSSQGTIITSFGQAGDRPIPSRP